MRERKDRWTFWLLVVACWGVMAFQPARGHQREVLHPCFVTASTGKIEVKRVWMTPEQTVMEVWFYGAPGEEVLISSNTVLRTSVGELALLDGERVSVDGRTEPERIGSSGRHLATLFFPPVPEGVYSADLVEKEAGWMVRGIQLTHKEPYVYVPSFLQSAVEMAPEKPVWALAPGQAVVNGYILGYDEGMDLKASLHVEDGLVPSGEGLQVKIRQDGSFHLEADLLLAGVAELRLGQGVLNLWLVPGEELTVYVHLPHLSMSACRGLAHRMKNSRKAWCDGKWGVLNNALANGHEAVEVSELKEDWCRYLSEYRADLSLAAEIYQQLLSKGKLDASEKKKINEIAVPEIRQYLQLRMARFKSNMERAMASESYVVAHLDSLVQGADILPAIVVAHDGRAVLIDFWATWCGPCRKSMRALQVLKKRLPSKEVTYIYITGPSSSEEEWNSMIPEMKGIHYRVTAEQWDYLCRSYGITGIPGYLVFSYDGKLQDRYVGFPGVDVLMKDIQRALE